MNERHAKDYSECFLVGIVGLILTKMLHLVTSTTNIERLEVLKCAGHVALKMFKKMVTIGSKTDLRAMK